MEPLWSPVVATGRNRRQMPHPRKRRKQAKTVAMRCDRLPETFHGKGAPPLRKGGGRLPGSARSAKSCEPYGPQDCRRDSATSWRSRQSLRLPRYPRISRASIVVAAAFAALAAGAAEPDETRAVKGRPWKKRLRRNTRRGVDVERVSAP